MRTCARNGMQGPTKKARPVRHTCTCLAGTTVLAELCTTGMHKRSSLCAMGRLLSGCYSNCRVAHNSRAVAYALACLCAPLGTTWASAGAPAKCAPCACARCTPLRVTAMSRMPAMHGGRKLPPTDCCVEASITNHPLSLSLGPEMFQIHAARDDKRRASEYSRHVLQSTSKACRRQVRPLYSQTISIWLSSSIGFRNFLRGCQHAS